MTSVFGKYAKFVTAVVTSAVTILSTYYGGQHWFSIVVAGLGAAGVYAVPNKAADVPATPGQASNVTVLPPAAQAPGK